VSAANRDPAIVTDPDAFRTDRAPAERHLAFARGPHACLGAALAVGQTALAQQELLTLPGVHLDPDASTGVSGLVLRKPERVVLRWR
jgi:cytochrome P450